MPPIVSLIALFLYMFSGFSLGSSGLKIRKYIEKVLPWLAAIFMIIGVSISVSLSDDVDPQTIPAYNYCIMEFAITIIMLIVTSIIRSVRKRRGIVETVVPKKQLSETEEKIKSLPDSEAGRSNIVRKFSEKFGLNLTTLQIKSIVDGSFLSEKWALEIWAMDQKYASFSGWYAGDTDWLRAYLKAFNVQNVSADFDVQKEYCKSNFKEVLTAIKADQFSDIESYIAQINNTFMTNFDETTFMIAYRFLLKAGVRVDLPKAGIVRAVNEIDDLARKYDNIEQSNKMEI